jgi:DNA (cytosine-5)-methyltransferase 1
MNLIPPSPVLRTVDFFCSAGGVTCGLRQAGLTVLAGIDVDKRCELTYELNNPGSEFIESNISELTVTELQHRLNIESYDDGLLFVGCSPCQYYSIMQTNRDQSWQTRLLLADFERFIDYFRPGYILIENVPGIDKKAGSPLSGFKKNLTKWAYRLSETVVNASHYGVPQNRRRYILMATRLPGELLIPPGDATLAPTVRSAIDPERRGFAPIGPGHVDPTPFMHTTTRLSPLNIERLLATPVDGGTRLAWRHDPHLQLRCYVGRDDDFVDVYGRMFWDLPSPTITTKFNSITNGRFAHPDQHRGLSLREGAVLQSFPDTYTFHSTSTNTIARMIGNAVPPELVRRLGITLMNHYHAAIQG